jgi:hypothetical protein
MSIQLFDMFRMDMSKLDKTGFVILNPRISLR